MERRFAQLPEQVDITIHCGCTRVVDVKARWMVKKFGPCATVEEAERRLICRTCKERPRLSFSLQFGTKLSIQAGTPPPQLPDWARFVLNF